MALVLITSIPKHVPSSSNFLVVKDTVMTRLLLPKTHTVVPTVILPLLRSRILNIVLNILNHLHLRKIERKYQGLVTRKDQEDVTASLEFAHETQVFVQVLEILSFISVASERN